MTGFVEVADGVLVAAYRPWRVNVGLVLGGEAALLVDTGWSLSAGRRVLDDVRRVTGLPVRHVVDTHVHFDHAWGAGAFDAATLHAHTHVARAQEGDTARIKAAFRADPGAAPEYGYDEQDVVDALATDPRPPDALVEASASVDLGGRVVRLSWTGRAHTDGDLAVHVADVGVVFLGDVVEDEPLPAFGGDSYPLEWAATLTAHLEGLDAGTVVVPGHGPAASYGWAVGQRDDVARAVAAAQDALAREGSADRALAAAVRATGLPEAALAPLVTRLTCLTR
ncbi:MBL fold metallo-hydrolase [Lapillicoccus jejuensis]|uniref:Glyoxylase-like metal-dependent hydrolase (Beta-lactamase superfamily II) n=1 Tax=Lapillicoccus jejuensis TaxID=402171 RepID=A0A542E3T7_9MICO|nr:MBL fold metallo-hydrolase [Lapillicoccus jejuensis]TQJ10001.1 glyoxylase-like metal-dependent hydrolase (beta-lactamase superfamily II) [Lapillicoccus jejuensis]